VSREISDDFDFLWKQAFEAAKSAAGWSVSSPQTLAEAVAQLYEMPTDSQGYAPFLKFLAFLVSCEELPQTRRDSLRSFGHKQGETFAQILSSFTQTQTQVEKRSRGSSCLLIWVQKSKVQQNQYEIKGFLIPDLEKPSDIKDLDPELTADYFERNQVLSVIQSYLQQCKKYRLKELQIELFLPNDLLGQYIEKDWTFQKRSSSGSVPICCEYSVHLRCGDRLEELDLWDRWEDRWLQLQEKIKAKTKSKSVFLPGNIIPKKPSMGDFRYHISQDHTIAVQLPETLPDDFPFLDLLIEYSVPAALWMRQDLAIVPYQVSEINTLLECELGDLTRKLCDKRKETYQDCYNENNHIGYHLALLWDNPFLLPPEFNYI